MHIAHLARTENELLASPLEDELRLVFREHVRGAVVLLRQLFLPLHHLAGEANDHVVLIGLSVDRDGSECGPFDLHGLILVPGLRTRFLTPMSSLRCHRCRLDALGSRRSQTGRLRVISSSNPIILNEASRGEQARQVNDPMFIGRCSQGQGAFGRSMHRRAIRNGWTPLAATWSTGYCRRAYGGGGEVRGRRLSPASR